MEGKDESDLSMHPPLLLRSFNPCGSAFEGKLLDKETRSPLDNFFVYFGLINVGSSAIPRLAGPDFDWDCGVHGDALLFTCAMFLT